MGVALHEVKHEEPQPGQPHHRWFQSDYFDVFFWYNRDGALDRWQLCYDRYGDEHMLTWDRETNRLAHHAVDEGKGFFGHGTSGMLEAARRPPPDTLAEHFRTASASLAAEMREPILRVIAEAPAAP